MTSADTHEIDTMSGSYESLRDKIEAKTAVVGVIGLGYVGLPLAHALHEGGLRVVGFDIDPEKPRALSEGRNYLKHLGEAMTVSLSSSDRFEATTDFSRLHEADVILVCVPTPLGPHREPDLSYVLQTAQDIGATLRPGQLIVLESTTYPGTTRDEFLPALLDEASAQGIDLQIGHDIFLAFSPEREDPGREDHTTSTIPKLVGGLDEHSTELACMAYRIGIDNIVPVSSAEVAEAAKILENTFRAVNIALVNELKTVLTEMDIDIWEVIEAASTKPFGFMPFYPGPGLGGHCIPIDPFYLTWKAKEVGRPTRFIELAGEVNTAMPSYVIERLSRALNDHSKAVQGSRVLVIGLAYKGDIDDTRESPSLELIEQLRERGADVSYHDPHVPHAVPVRKHDITMSSVELTASTIASFDCVLISTAHKAVDFCQIAQHAQLVVDTRNAMRPFQESMGDRLVKA
ncbi:MAG: nucleotide sugar dehydrogenase [Phycisphaerales bacterium JB043]